MTTYEINMVDSETPSAWMELCLTMVPGGQDSGRCNFRVTTEHPEALEAALEADRGVLSYSEISDASS